VIGLTSNDFLTKNIELSQGIFNMIPINYQSVQTQVPTISD